LQKLNERGRQEVLQLQQQLAQAAPTGGSSVAAGGKALAPSPSAALGAADGSGSGDAAGAGDAEDDAKAPSADKSKRKGGATGAARKRPRK
jgi:hypothetical protein